MEVYVGKDINRILILGAGASVEYGMPLWRELATLIKKKIDQDTSNSYKYKNEILDWIAKIGKGKSYATIDECIYRESVSGAYHSNGLEIENEIFSIIKEIFIDAYHRNNTGGWIRLLNQKILHNTGNQSFEDKIAFVNYNYDQVLHDNFLNYEHLPAKHSRLTFRDRLNNLAHVSVPTLFGHGTLFSEYGDRGSNLDKHTKTIKTGDNELIDAVSCYESSSHAIRSYYPAIARSVYILGLGEGLKVNLENLYFGFPITKVHVTIKDKNLETGVVSFLSEKFSISPGEIKIYDSCEDLIEKCF